MKARHRHQVRSRALAVAIGVTGDGRREVLGFAVGDGEDLPFWEDFLSSLADRGLTGVNLVFPDAHSSIKAAVQTRLPGAAWQSCRIHFGRNIARRAGSRPNQPLAMAAFSTIYNQADRETAVAHYHYFAAAMEKLAPRLGDYVDDREVELTAYADFPPVHLAQDLVHQSPGAPHGRDLSGAAGWCRSSPMTNRSRAWRGRSCASSSDEWIASERRYMSQESMRQIGKVVAHRDDIDGQTGQLVAAPKDW